MAVFFSFICSSLLALLYFNGQAYSAMPEPRLLLACIVVLLLVTAAYTGSCYGRTFLPLITAIMGAVCACGFCMVALGLKERDMSCFYLLPLLLLAVPLQFAMSVSGMRISVLLRRAVNEAPLAVRAEMKAQNVMMLLSAAALAGLTAYIIFR